HGFRQLLPAQPVAQYALHFQQHVERQAAAEIHLAGIEQDAVARGKTVGQRLRHQGRSPSVAARVSRSTSSQAGKSGSASPLTRPLALPCCSSCRSRMYWYLTAVAPRSASSSRRMLVRMNTSRLVFCTVVDSERNRRPTPGTLPRIGTRVSFCCTLSR